MDLDILAEASDLQMASRQMDLAELTYYEAAETASNKQRELHELKPPSWWEKTFNTDGALRHREAQKEMQMSLNFAKDTMTTMATRQVVLNPAATKFKKEGYDVLLAKLQKVYGSAKKKAPADIIQKAQSGQLAQGDALAYASSTAFAAKAYQKSVKEGSLISEQREKLSKQISDLPQPGIFATLLKTKSFQAYKKQKEQLETKAHALKEKHHNIGQVKKKNHQAAFEYFMVGAFLLDKYKAEDPYKQMENPQPGLKKNPENETKKDVKEPVTEVSNDTNGLQKESRRIGESDPTGLGLDPQTSKALRDKQRYANNSWRSQSPQHPHNNPLNMLEPPVKKK